MRAQPDDAHADRAELDLDGADLFGLAVEEETARAWFGGDAPILTLDAGTSRRVSCGRSTDAVATVL